MSRSSVLKSNWVIVDPADTRVIDTNALAELKLRQMAVKLAEQCGEEPDEFVEGFTQGINAVQVSELMRGEANVIGGGQEAMEEPLDMDYNSAQFQPDQPETLPHEELIAEAQAQIEAKKEEAIAEIQQAREQAIAEGKDIGYQEGLEIGKQEGFQQGHQEGLDSVASEREQVYAQANEQIAAIESEYEQKLSELEPKFIDTLTGIYEHIFHVSLRNSRELIVYLIQNTMRNIESSNGYLVHVSKEDYPFASMQKKELVKNTNISLDDVELIEDATLAKNECMIETGSGVFDCSLGTQLEALNEELRLLSYGG